MKYIRRSISIVLAIMIFTTTIYAKDTKEENQENAVAYGNALAYSMNLILDEYYGDVSVEALYQAALKGMSTVLDDYSTYMTEDEWNQFISSMSGYMQGIGISINFGEGSYSIENVLVDSPAQKAGVLPGDLLVSLNEVVLAGKSIPEVYALLDQYPDKIILGLSRNGKEIPLTIKKESIKNTSVHTADLKDLLPDVKDTKTGYISISLVDLETAKDFKIAVNTLREKNTRNLILDFRDNPGGAMDVCLEIANTIVPEGTVLEVVDAYGEKTVYRSNLKTPIFDRIVVLTNEGTASAAEVLSAALQDSGSTVVGETTYGKGVIQEVRPVPGGVLKLTYQEYFRRNGKTINHIGVTPDVIVKIPNFLYSAESFDIPALKELLQYLGYTPGASDTIIDKDTMAAIQQFQKTKSLEQTGKLDVKTILALNRTLYDAIKSDDKILKKAYEIITQ